MHFAGPGSCWLMTKTGTICGKPPKLGLYSTRPSSKHSGYMRTINHGVPAVKNDDWNWTCCMASAVQLKCSSNGYSYSNVGKVITEEVVPLRVHVVKAATMTCSA